MPFYPASAPVTPTKVAVIIQSNIHDVYFILSRKTDIYCKMFLYVKPVSQNEGFSSWDVRASQAMRGYKAAVWQCLTVSDAV